MFVPFKIKKTTIESVCDGYQYDTENVTNILKTNINLETIKKQFIDGTRLQDEWFPTRCYDSQFQVFISHAHKDYKTASMLAGYLYEEYGLRSFIDSVYWGYIADLLYDLNYHYSLIEKDGRRIRYDYNTGNFLSANVHIMLSNALMRMMDACECLIFIDSDNSLKYKKDQSTTPSPWLFEEISFSQYLRINIPYRYKERILIDLNESQSQSTIRMFSADQERRIVNIDYEINIRDFKELTLSDLNNYCGMLSGHKLLDKWYDKYGVQKVLKKIVD